MGRDAAGELRPVGTLERRRNSSPMKQIASAAALALILAACSGQEPAAESEADMVGATPSASADDSAVDADAAMDEMARDGGTDGSRRTWIQPRLVRRQTPREQRSTGDPGGFASDIRVNGNALAVAIPSRTRKGEPKIAWSIRPRDGGPHPPQGGGKARLTSSAPINRSTGARLRSHRNSCAFSGTPLAGRILCNREAAHVGLESVEQVDPPPVDIRHVA